MKLHFTSCGAAYCYAAPHDLPMQLATRVEQHSSMLLLFYFYYFTSLILLLYYTYYRL